MTRQGKNPGKAKGGFYVLSLEVKGGHITGGTGTVSAGCTCRRPDSLNIGSRTSVIN